MPETLPSLCTVQRSISKDSAHLLKDSLISMDCYCISKTTRHLKLYQLVKMLLVQQQELTMIVKLTGVWDLFFLQTAMVFHQQILFQLLHAKLLRKLYAYMAQLIYLNAPPFYLAYLDSDNKCTANVEGYRQVEKNYKDF